MLEVVSVKTITLSSSANSFIHLFSIELGFKTPTKINFRFELCQISKQFLISKSSISSTLFKDFKGFRLIESLSTLS